MKVDSLSLTCIFSWSGRKGLKVHEAATRLKLSSSGSGQCLVRKSESPWSSYVKYHNGRRRDILNSKQRCMYASMCKAMLLGKEAGHLKETERESLGTAPALISIISC